MISDAVIERAARLLAESARPPAKVILFGSHARGMADGGSDLDFLVIEHDVEDRFEEAVRLRAALDPLRIPADVVVVDARRVEEWGEVGGTMLHAALSEGRVLAEV